MRLTVFVSISLTNTQLWAGRKVFAWPIRGVDGISSNAFCD